MMVLQQYSMRYRTSKLFMSKHCKKHNIVGRVYKTGGFGFVFPKGSPLVADVSRAILKVTEGDEIVGIERKWFGDEVACNSQTNAIESGSVITLSSLRGVFYVTMGLWAIAGIIYAAIWRWGQGQEKVQEAVAELAIEHVDAGENITWPIGRHSHLVIRLHGNPPPPPPSSPPSQEVGHDGETTGLDR
uniref:Solute-binding protein family 3/N-terminal domain-containing protein n=1 Tax=Arundo donax TaxID=35708 RepID=A0A0A9BM83_ARUDO